MNGIVNCQPLPEQIAKAKEGKNVWFEPVALVWVVIFFSLFAKNKNEMVI